MYRDPAFTLRSSHGMHVVVLNVLAANQLVKNPASRTLGVRLLVHLTFLETVGREHAGAEKLEERRGLFYRHQKPLMDAAVAYLVASEGDHYGSIHLTP